MPYTTFAITPAGFAQADDAELMINDNNGQTSFTFPANIIITDVLSTTVLGDTHQFAFQVNGVKSTSNAYSPIINPNSSGRMSWADLKFLVPAGNSFAISTGQQSGVAVETWRILIKYEPVK
tara:strand:- start:262 stop:627 length:366 start_codon:yes stop_codon:yes gene_type:complete